MDEIQKLAKGLTYKEIIICKLLRDTEIKKGNKQIVNNKVVNSFFSTLMSSIISNELLMNSIFTSKVIGIRFIKQKNIIDKYEVK